MKVLVKAYMYSNSIDLVRTVIGYVDAVHIQPNNGRGKKTLIDWFEVVQCDDAEMVEILENPNNRFDELRIHPVKAAEVARLRKKGVI